MRTLRLIAFVTLAGFSIAEPVWAQSKPVLQTSQMESGQPEPDQPQTSPDSSSPAPSSPPNSVEPLQVTEQDREQFFTPAPRPRSVEALSGSTSQSDSLIQPPPGSQTPGQLTPARRLNFPIP